MAIRFEFEKHGVCFPSKTLSGNGGAHELNIVVTTDTDNGTVCGVGDYVSFDQYKAATVPSTFEGKILEQAVDGGWYIQVTKVDINNPAVLIYTPEVIAEKYDHRFTDLSNFFNPKDSTVRGKVLVPYDVYEISENLFTGTPVAGKKVTITGQKHVVGA